MDHHLFLNGRFRNILHSALLLLGLAVLMAFMGFMIAGKAGVVMALGLGFAAFIFTPKLSPMLVMRMSGARPITFYESPMLHRMVQELAARAGLPKVPRLYYIQQPVMNAFSVGTRQEPAVALTAGLVNRLNERELFGVMAHEVSHIRNNDIWILNLAGMAGRVTSVFSMFGQIMLLLSLPLLFLSSERFSFSFLIFALVLSVTPHLSSLLQLALSRTREFNADLEAARLTGDPVGLASALEKLAGGGQSWFERIFKPQSRQTVPTWLNTHPNNEERIKRLLALRANQPRRLARVSPSWV